MAKSKSRGLGRGLESLFETVEIKSEDKKEQDDNLDNDKIKVEGKDGLIRVDINHIMPNKDQPRKTFNEEKLDELAASIIENGLIQPIVVRPLEKGYEIVAGERRWRAARKAKLKRVPCVVRELTREQNMIFAIIENMQREDLNPIEEAKGIENMINTFGMTQEEVSKSLGKSRPYITNAIRLLKLDKKILNMVMEGEISAAHGRTLLSEENEEKRLSIAKKIVKEGMSVRKLEKLISNKSVVKRGKPAKRARKTGDTMVAERELVEYLGTKVEIKGSPSRGTIEIEYYSMEELNRIIDMIK